MWRKYFSHLQWYNSFWSWKLIKAQLISHRKTGKKTHFYPFHEDNYKITFWKRELWLAKSRVSVTAWKTWKCSRHYTPSHTPSRTVWRIHGFGKEGYFHVLLFYGLFYKRNRKHFFHVFPAYVIETLVEVWENFNLLN